jgi:hypothetical protein
LHRFTFPAAVLAALALATPAAAAPDKAATVTFAEPTQALEGDTATGVNVSYFLDPDVTTGTCAKDPDNYCSTFLFKADEFTGTAGSGTNRSATLTFRMDGFSEASDFDLRVYESDADGTKGAFLGYPETSDIQDTSPLGDLDPRATFLGDYETKVVTGVRPGKHFLVEVPYFFAIEDRPVVTATLSKAAAPPAPEAGS